MGRKKGKSEWRSGCPLNASVEMLGDQWSLLIIRDMMLRGSRTFTEFLDSYEMIATNVLADRLRRLEAHGILTKERDAKDQRKQIYRLTEKGIDLGPVLTEMVLWAAGHEATQNAPLVRKIRKDKKGFLAGIRQRWAAVAGRAGDKRVRLGRSSEGAQAALDLDEHDGTPTDRPGLLEVLGE